MTHKEALTELLTKVEAGDATFDASVIGGIHYVSQLHVVHAYKGSLDAAKALHEAVLPGWGVNLVWPLRGRYNEIPQKRAYSCILFRHDPLIRYIEIKNTDLARAWLIAILEALIAECDK